VLVEHLRLYKRGLADFALELAGYQVPLHVQVEGVLAAEGFGADLAVVHGRLTILFCLILIMLMLFINGV